MLLQDGECDHFGVVVVDLDHEHESIQQLQQFIQVFESGFVSFALAELGQPARLEEGVEVCSVEPHPVVDSRDGELPVKSVGNATLEFE